MQARRSELGSIFRGTATYALALVANKGASFLLLPLYTRYLTPADYGALELLSLTAFILTTLIFMRFGDALFYFHGRAASRNSADRAVWTIFVTSIVLGAILATAGWAASPILSRIVFNDTRYGDAFHLVFAAAGFSFIVELGYAYLRLLNRSGWYIGLSMFNLFVGAACNVLLLVGFHLGMLAMLWSSLVTAILTASVMAVIMYRDISASAGVDFVLARDVVRYSFPLGFSGLGMFVLNFGDRYFLQRTVTLADVGIYALAYKFGMLVSYLQSPFDTYWRSQMYSIMEKTNGRWLYVRVCTYLTLGLAFFAVCLSLISGPLLRLTVARGYWPAAALIPWIAAAYVIRALGAQFRCVFFLEGETRKELLVTGSGGLVCLAGYAALIPRFGAWGAVASTLVGFTWMLIFGFWQAQRVRHFAFEYRRLAIIAVASSGSVALLHVIPIWNDWVELIVGMLLIVIFPAILYTLRFLDKEEVEYLRTFSRAILRRENRSTVAAGA